MLMKTSVAAKLTDGETFPRFQAFGSVPGFKQVPVGPDELRERWREKGRREKEWRVREKVGDEKDTR